MGDFQKTMATASGDPAEILTATSAGCRRAFGWVGLFSLCINALMLTVPLYTLQIFDRVIASQSRETLIFLTIIALGAVLVLGLIELVRSRILIRVSIWIEQRLAPEAFERGLAAALYGRPYRTQALRDLGQMRSFFGGPAVLSLFDGPWVPIFLAVTFLLHPLVGLVALAGAVVLFVLAVLNELLTRTPLQLASQAAIDAISGPRRMCATPRRSMPWA